MNRKTAHDHRRRRPRLALAALGLIAGTTAAAIGIGTALAGSPEPDDQPRKPAVERQAGEEGEPKPLGEPPKNDTKKGMVYSGLEAAPAGDDCVGMYRLSEDGQCSHGPDAPPQGVDIKKDTPPVGGTDPAAPRSTGDTAAKALAAPGAKPACIGDGTSGNRVEVLYVHAPGQNRLQQYQSSFKQWAAEADAVYNASAEETGGTRRIRYLTEADCTPKITEVEVQESSFQSFGATNRELAAKGFDRRDRKYVLFADSKRYCGIGTMAPDDRSGADNRSNFGPAYARADSGCWGGNVVAHELGHNLGAVNNSAPNSNRNGHCVDEWDLMCYVDDSGVGMKTVCPDRAHESRLDCNHDDYFSTAPKPGSYLATHWNIADSVFLSKGEGTGPPTAPKTGPKPVATKVTATSATLTWSKVPAAEGYNVKVNGKVFRNVRKPVLRLTSLWPGTAYKVTVAAVKAKKPSAPGPAVTFKSKESR